jgi:hypothetical protein
VAEVAVAAMLAAVLWLPPLIGTRARLPALGLVALLAVYSIIRQRRLPPIPLFMVVYLAVYALATAHGGVPHLGELKEGYFVRPLTALAVAAVVITPVQRLRAVLLVVFFAATQVPVTAIQALENVASHGRNSVAVGAEDSVTGLLGAWQDKPATLATVAAAAIVVAGWLTGDVGGRWAILLGGGLVAVGAFTSTRASGIFVVATGTAIVLVALWAWWPDPPLQRLFVVAVATIVAGAGVVGLTALIYKGAFSGALKTQEAHVTAGGGRTAGGGGQAGSGLTEEPTAPGQPAVNARGDVVACTIAPGTQGNTCLPGRVEQLRLAVHLSVRDGVGIALLGRGPGSAYISETATHIPAPRRTGTTWIGKVLTETGWMGVAAFLGILGWLVLLGRRLARRREGPTGDRVLGVALPGIVALTAVGAAYIDILTTRGYAYLFWLVVGIAISAGYEGRSVRRDRAGADG